MNKKIKQFIWLFALPLLMTACASQSENKVTVETLLDEMIDRERLTEFPDPVYTCKQFSSYDRSSVSADLPGWFANWDRSHFLRKELNNGRREFVMMDTKGPGAIVRFWITLAAYGGNGTLRIYLDGSEKPVIEGEVLKIISGDGLVETPLASSVSEDTEYLQRGHNLYLPIPYAQCCKVTYESDALTEEPGGQKGEQFYYNINYRTYEEGTVVKTFEKSDLERYSTVLNRVQKALITSNTGSEKKMFAESKTLLAGEVLQKELSGEKAIEKICVKLDAKNFEQALRSTVLEIEFDGEHTVWCPIGDFFGTGYQLSPYKSFYTEVTKDSTLTCNWVMPFEESCNVVLKNYSNNDVEIKEFSIEATKKKWNSSSMYFGAGWFEQYHLFTGAGGRPMEATSGDMFDVNYVTLTGKGVLVGTGVTLFNTAKIWWGEGDEKVYVDGEAFPSHFGTGTEDYYGYAWCKANKFSHPFIAQPEGSGAIEPGYVVNQRFRGLDAIPFTKSLKFDMEMWHWAETTINHAPVSFWYMLPGGKSNLKPVPRLVKNRVALKKEDILGGDDDN